MSDACAAAASTSVPAAASSARLMMSTFIVASSSCSASEVDQHPDTAFGVGAIHRAADLAVEAARIRSGVAVRRGDGAVLDLLVLNREGDVDLLVRMPGEARVVVAVLECRVHVLARLGAVGTREHGPGRRDVVGHPH